MTQAVKVQIGNTDEYRDAALHEIPDLWHLGQNLKDKGEHQASEMVLKCWPSCSRLQERTTKKRGL